MFCSCWFPSHSLSSTDCSSGFNRPSPFNMNPQKWSFVDWRRCYSFAGGSFIKPELLELNTNNDVLNLDYYSIDKFGHAGVRSR